MDRFDKCWEVKECRRKEECAVFPHFGRSCWIIKGKLRTVLERDGFASCLSECESCEVYNWQMAFLNLGERNRVACSPTKLMEDRLFAASPPHDAKR
jgi:hypothetical protein